MPVSPVKQDFATPVAGSQQPLEDMQREFDTKMGKIAVALGGDVKTMTPPSQEAEETVVELPDEDKKSYLRSLLALEPFQKVYTLFNKVNVTFRTRSIAENEKLTALEREDATEAYKQKFVTSLVSIYVNDKAVSIDDTKKNDILYYALFKAFREFEDLCDELYRRAADPNF